MTSFTGRLVDPRPLDGLLDDQRAELGRAQRAQRSLEGPQGRAHGARNDDFSHVLSHFCLDRYPRFRGPVRGVRLPEDPISVNEESRSHEQGLTDAGVTCPATFSIAL